MVKGLPRILNHKLIQFVLVLVIAYLAFKLGIPALSLLLTGRAAPIPSQVLWAIYMPTILLAMLLFVSANETAWEEFKSPLRTFLNERERRPVVISRMVVLVALPLLAGWLVYNRVQPQVSPPAELRAIHPAPPASITVDGEMVNLRAETNPFRIANGSPDPQAVAAGKMLYGQYCVYCHGDALDGKGLFAAALRPPPANFTDPGTIGQLQEAFLFWRIAEGGPGMPHEGKGWNSAMPAWKGTLSQEEMWQIILYLYDATGQNPLSVDEASSPVRVAAVSTGQSIAAQDLDHGQAVYSEHCEVCHGVEGDANTEAAAQMDPRPRDLRRGWYKIRTTASGQLPLDSDMVRVIEQGMPGTTMPGWKDVLNEEEIQAVVSYIKTFSRRFEREQPAAVEAGSKVQASPESIARGKEIYMGTEAECLKCHGNAGRGDGPSADELTEDSFGDVIVPADLSMPWLFRGGPTVDEIYMRMKTGLTGSPMPSYADVLSDEDLWHLANYVDSLGPDTPSELEPLILASRSSNSAIPDDPNADDWLQAEEFYYPLFGQVMREPRNYTPSVSGVWVKALYNDQEIALRVRWHDRIPDSGEDSGEPDSFAIQFPATLPETDERPYFVFGDPAHPVNLWIWSAAAEAAEEWTANGEVSESPQAVQNLRSSATYVDGEYTLIVRRDLNTGDPEDIRIEPDKFIPIAFAASDGWRAEQLSSGAISSWFVIYLDRPVSIQTLVWVPVAMLIVALVEAVGIWTIRHSAEKDA